jgi:hypothetical protein
VTGPSEDTTGRANNLFPGRISQAAAQGKLHNLRSVVRSNLLPPAIMPRKMLQKLDGTIRI